MFFVTAMVVLLLSGCCDKCIKGVRGVEHVVMIGFDGLAGNYVEAANMTNLKALMAQGSWTLQSQQKYNRCVY